MTFEIIRERGSGREGMRVSNLRYIKITVFFLINDLGVNEMSIMLSHLDQLLNF